MIFKCILMAVSVLAAPVQAQGVFPATVTHVSDGDTLWVRPDAGGAPRKLRIDGIDAPEICQAGGEAARAALLQLVLHRRVAVSVRRHDDYGRALARLQLDDESDLGARLVRAGHAWSYRWRAHPGPYAAEEAMARQSRQGLFAADQPELPRDFRKRHGSCQEVGD